MAAGSRFAGGRAVRGAAAIAAACALALTGTATPVAPAGAAAAAYTVRDIGSPPDHPGALGEAINDRGQVGGEGIDYVSGGIIPHAFFWDPDTGFRNLPAEAYNVRSIDGTGHLVGDGMPSDGSGRTYGYRWTPSDPSALESLGLPDGWVYAQAYATNDSGTVLGVGRTPTAYLNWRHSLSASAPDVLPGIAGVAGEMRPFAINSSGVAVGTAETPGCGIRAVKWTPDPNGSYSAAFMSPDCSQAIDINDVGQVLGSFPAGNVIVEPDGTMTPILGSDGTQSFGPRAMNAFGDVAGIDTSSGSAHPAVWSNGKVTDLMPYMPADVWSMMVKDINSAGQVLVTVELPAAVEGGHAFHSLVLTPAGSRPVAACNGLTAGAFNTVAYSGTPIVCEAAGAPGADFISWSAVGFSPSSATTSRAEFETWVSGATAIAARFSDGSEVAFTVTITGDTAIALPVPKGTVLRVVHGYNDPSKAPPSKKAVACEISTALDHCRNQMYSLDFELAKGKTGFEAYPAGAPILAPAPGRVLKFVTGYPGKSPADPGACAKFMLEDGRVMNLCHFAAAGRIAEDSALVQRGTVLGYSSAQPGAIHMSIDDNTFRACVGGWIPETTKYSCPFPFAGPYAIQGQDFPWHGKVVKYGEWYGTTMPASTNSAAP